MAEPNIKTGGYTNNNSNIRTAKSTGVNTGHNAAQHNSGRLSDNLSGWIGEPDTNSTTDTGIEAVNVAVLPAAKKVAGKAVNKVVDSLVDKATSSIAAPKRYKVSPSSMNTIRKNVSTEHESPSNENKTGRRFTYKRSAAPRSYARPSSSGARTSRNAVRARQEANKVSPSSGVRAVRRNVSSGRKLAVPNAVRARQEANKISPSSSGIKTKRQYVLSSRLRTGGRSVALPPKVKTRQQRNHTGQPVSAIKTSRQNISARRKTIINAVKSGKLTYRKPEKVNRFTWNKSMPPKTSNAHIDNSKVSDTGYESVQGIRASNDKVKQAAHIGKNIAMATGAAATIMTGRYINENAKLSLKGYAFQGNTTFKRFYATNAKIDKESTTNTGKEIIQGTRIAVKTGRNAVVGVKNTVRGAKKTYKFGRQIYTKTKTVVRNTSKTIKSIKNAKSSVEKVKIAARAFVNSLKAVVNTVKALVNPLVLKGLAIIAAVLLLLVIMSGAVQAIASIINSNFGWLYNPSDPTQTVDTVLDGHKTKIVGFIDNVNTNYTNTKNNHTGYEYGFHDTGSEYSVKTDTYKDILAILVVNKQKLHGSYGNTDPNGVYDLTNVTFNDNEIKDVLNRFYTFSTRSGTYYCSGCDCNGHSGSHSFPSCYKLNCTTNHTHTSSCYTLNCSSSHTYYCRGCTCPSGHSALYVKIVNHSKESVMATLGFTPEEIERATLISQYLDDIEAGNY